MQRSFIARNPSVLIFLSLLALFTLAVTDLPARPTAPA